MTQGPRVLVVEDEKCSAAAMIKTVEIALGTSAEIILAGTLAEAMGWLARASFRLVILDLSLPDSQGWATVKAVAPAAREAGARLLVVSGHLSGVEDDLESNAIPAIGKPYRMGKVTEQIRALIADPRPVKSLPTLEDATISLMQARRELEEYFASSRRNGARA